MRDSHGSDSSHSVVVQPHTLGETVWKEHPSIPEFICHDIYSQHQLAIHELSICKSLLFLNSQPIDIKIELILTDSNTLASPILFSLHFPLSRYMPELICTVAAIACPHSNSAGMLNDLTECRLCCGGCLNCPAVLTYHCWIDSWTLLTEWE